MPVKIMDGQSEKIETVTGDVKESPVIRQTDFPELPCIIPGLLEGHITLWAGVGGVGKTTLVEQIVRHLASGVQLGRLPLPDEPMPVWALFLEDPDVLSQMRSFDVAPRGSLDEDQYAPGSGKSLVWYNSDIRGTHMLRATLDKEERKGRPCPKLIAIDYLHLFTGPQMAGMSITDWERRELTRLRELAMEKNLHILVLTHMTKEGKVNGTAVLQNATDSLFVLEQNPDDRFHGTLKCIKMRVGPQTDYAMGRKANGTWSFTDERLVAENQLEGIAAQILAHLKSAGPRTLNQLCGVDSPVTGGRAGIRSALTRMRKRGYVQLHCSHWSLQLQDGDKAFQKILCAACGGPLDPVLRGPVHPTCNPDSYVAPPPPAQPEPAAAVIIPAQRPVPESETIEEPVIIPQETEEYFQQEPEPRQDHRRGGWGLKLMKKCVDVSRFHPVKWIPPEERDAEPWSLMTPDLACKPQWQRSCIPSGGAIVTIDRNGSYPSACSSVPVAPNKLLHTGALPAYDKHRAGIFLVDVPAWDEEATGLPHPLGPAAAFNEPMWVSTPHLALLDRLHTEGTITAPVIHDSWTGVANATLFNRFYLQVRTARKDFTGKPHKQADYEAMKKSVCQAIGMLAPLRPSVQSPFWRLDWPLTIAAESSVRHWIGLRNATVHARENTTGIILTRVQLTDEASFWTPDGTLPAPYTEGTAFGQVKIKREKTSR